MSDYRAKVRLLVEVDAICIVRERANGETEIQDIHDITDIRDVIEILDIKEKL